MKPNEKDAGKLERKIALVTGGNSGIGLATAKQFVNEGAYVFITGRRKPELAAAVKKIGKNVTSVEGDVSNLDDLDRLFAQIQKEKGKLDIVFANAGVAEYASLGEITEEHYDSIFNINVKGLLFTVQKALPLIADGSSIILNASVVASKGLPSNSVYSATKAAVRSFARTWTTDLKNRRIRVNVVSPGSIETPGLNNLLASSGAGDERLKMLSNNVPAGQARHVGRDRPSRCVSRIRRQQLHHRNGVVCGWRLRASVGIDTAGCSAAFEPSPPMVGQPSQPSARAKINDVGNHWPYRFDASVTCPSHAVRATVINLIVI
jgi:NAD(P)-dependent dehydrogenase (short-subunit alcohol dehydrogenase family)